MQAAIPVCGKVAAQVPSLVQTAAQYEHGRCTDQVFMPDLLAMRGKILNTASAAAFQPGPYLAPCCATQAFVRSFSQAVASELQDNGVTVTALCSGKKTATDKVAVAMADRGFIQVDQLKPKG